MMMQNKSKKAEIDVKDLISKIEPQFKLEFGEAMTKEVIESLNSMTGLLTNSFGELHQHLDKMEENLKNAINDHHDHDMVGF